MRKNGMLFLVLSMLTSVSWAQGSNMINEVIQNYFEGYQKANTQLILKAFHSDTRLLSVDNGKLDRTEMKDWLKNLEERHAKGDIRVGELTIQSIDVSADAATAKLKIVFPKFEFTDYLSLLLIDGKWTIVGKIYHYSPR
jgi:hypothetical protein